MPGAPKSLQPAKSVETSLDAADTSVRATFLIGYSNRREVAYGHRSIRRMMKWPCATL
jgi:hypothetical protein